MYTPRGRKPFLKTVLGNTFLAAGLAAGLATTALPALAGGASAALAKISPNKLSGAQAQTVLAADQDSFWKQAELQFPAKDATPAIPATKLNLFAKGSVHRREIALTFDDGPHPGYTPQLLAVLERFKIPATFFLVGEMAEKSPELVRDEMAAGDVVGNHTYHHVSLIKITPDEAAAEIKACDLVLESITGKAPRYFRPPGGKFDAAVAQEAAAQGYTTVLWTDDPGDYASPGVNVIEDRTLKTAHNGGILLLHDGIQQTIDALPDIIQRLRAEGYSFVTIDQLLKDRGAPPAAPGATI